MICNCNAPLQDGFGWCLNCAGVLLLEEEEAETVVTLPAEVLLAEAVELLEAGAAEMPWPAARDFVERARAALGEK